MKIKSIISVLLAASLALSLAACSGRTPAAKESGSEETSVTAEGGNETDVAEIDETVPVNETEAVQESSQADTQDSVQESAQADTRDSVQKAAQADTRDAADETAVTASSSAVTDTDTGDTSAEDIDEIIEWGEDFRREDAAPADSPIVDFDIGDLEAYESFPEKTEDISIDKAEFFKTEDGRDAIRVFFSFTNNYDEEISFSEKEYYYYALQDGNPLEDFLGPIPAEEVINIHQPVNPGEDVVCAHSFFLNTDSPVAFLMTVLNDDYTEDIPVAAKIIDIKK